MNKLAKLLHKTDKELFELFKNTLKQNIKTWDYFVDWDKVFNNIETIETELNILNSLIGAKNIKTKLTELLVKYPEIVKTFPILLAIREKSLDVLIDTNNFIYRHFDFSVQKFNKQKAGQLAEFIISSGLGEIIKDRKLKNLVDYVTGIEVGIQTNTRKNRTGKLMEKIVENFIIQTCSRLKAEYIAQATKDKIKQLWGYDIKIDRANRRIDFVLKFSGQLFFVETNFYAGGGSKLKATAGEYIAIADFWQKQNIEFIWVTDGFGWLSSLSALQEYFDKGYFLLNLEMLKQQYLDLILKNYGN